MRARNAGNGRPSALASGSEQRLEVVKTARGQRPRRRGAADPRFASRARKRAGGEFFEGCETSLRGSPALSTPGISLGNQRGGRRRVRGGNQRSPAGTRCNSLGTGARSKPPRWESNHAGGTCGSGGTDLPKGRQLPGSGRAPEMSARHPANEPSASETRRRQPEEARQRQSGAPRGTRWIQGEDPGRSPVQPIGGAQRCAQAPQLIHPARQVYLRRPVRRTALLRQCSRQPARERGHTRGSPLVWEGPGGRGGVREHGPASGV